MSGSSKDRFEKTFSRKKKESNTTAITTTTKKTSSEKIKTTDENITKLLKSLPKSPPPSSSSSQQKEQKAAPSSKTKLKINGPKPSSNPTKSQPPNKQKPPSSYHPAKPKKNPESLSKEKKRKAESEDVGGEMKKTKMVVGLAAASKNGKIENKEKKKEKKESQIENKDKKKKEKEEGRIENKDRKKKGKEEEDGTECVFPTARIARIVKSERSDFRLSGEAIFLINKAAEKFIGLFSEGAYGFAVDDRKSFVGYKHLSTAVSKEKRFEFLSEFVPEKVAAEKALAERNSPEAQPAYHFDLDHDPN